MKPNHYLHQECDKAIESGDYNKIRKNACHGCGGNRNLGKPKNIKPKHTQKCRGCEKQCPSGYVLCDDCYLQREVIKELMK